MKKLIVLLFTLITAQTNGQVIEKIYKNMFKYATVYTTYSEEDGFEAPPAYFVTQDGTVQDVTPDWDIDYQFSFGIRKISRLGYEKKQGEFYTGDEQVSLNSNYSPVKGLEYIVQIDKGRIHDREFKNQKYLVRYISKYWSVKGEYLDNRKIDLKYKSADIRARLPINNRLSFSAGATLRHHRPYGFNPIEEYLGSIRDMGDWERPLFWWDLAYDYGYSDEQYFIDYDGNLSIDAWDYYWYGPEGDRVADSDLDFRKNVYGGLVNDYNSKEFEKIGELGTLSLVVGADWYYYRPNFWIHAWSSVMPGVHKHVIGDEAFSYAGFLEAEDKSKKFIDYNIGVNFGLKLWKRVGIFTEYEITKFWDRRISSLKAGINYRL